MNECVHMHTEWTCCASESAAYPFFFFRLLSSSVVWAWALVVEDIGVCCVRVCDLKYLFVVLAWFLDFRWLYSTRRTDVNRCALWAKRQLDGITAHACILLENVPIHIHHDEWNHLQPRILVFSFQRRDAALLCAFLRPTQYELDDGMRTEEENPGRKCLCVCRHLKHGNERATFHTVTFERLRIFRGMCVEYKKSIFLLKFIPIHAKIRSINCVRLIAEQKVLYSYSSIGIRI